MAQSLRTHLNVSVFFVTFKITQCGGSHNIIMTESKNIVHLVPLPSTHTHTLRQHFSERDLTVLL